MKRALVLITLIVFTIFIIGCSNSSESCLLDQEYINGVCVDIDDNVEPELNIDNFFNVNTGNMEGWDFFSNFKDEPSMVIENGNFMFNQVFLEGESDSKTTWARKISYELEDIEGEGTYTLQFNAIGTIGETFTIFIQLGSTSNPVELDFTLDGSNQQFSMDIYHPLEVIGIGIIKIGFGTFNDGSSVSLSDVVITKSDLGEPDMNILFIGNSHTFYNNLPGMFEDMALMMGFNIHAEKLTMSGYPLDYYLDPERFVYDTLIDLLDNEAWDYVVLQEHSLKPTIYKQSFLDSVSELKQLILEKNPNAEVMLLQTWGYKDGSDVLESTGFGYTEMYTLLKEAYQEASNTYNTLLAPAGTVFYNLSVDDTGIDPLDIDDYHPSLIGSFAAALTCYTMLFDEEYNTEYYLPEGINKTDADIVLYYVKDALNID